LTAIAGIGKFDSYFYVDRWSAYQNDSRGNDNLDNDKASMKSTFHGRRQSLASIAGRAAAAALPWVGASGALAQDAAGYQGADRQQRLLDGARKEGALSVYSSTPADELAVLTAAFEKKYGIKVKLWRAGADKGLQRVVARQSK
jgi:hypothetical protein